MLDFSIIFVIIDVAIEFCHTRTDRADKANIHNIKLNTSGCSAVGSARALGERDTNSLNDCFIDVKSTKQGETEQNCVLGTLRLCDWTGRTKQCP